MTFLSLFPIRLPPLQQRLQAPRSLEAQDVSLIVPVKDNQHGLDTLLGSLMNIHNASCLPAEIIIVDNRSHPHIEIASCYRKKLPVTLLQCSRKGPASARNVGARHASGSWLWFCDSDCLLTEHSLKGYQQALNGAIGYAGWIRSTRRGTICRYYEEQRILIPPDVQVEAEVTCPLYIITANALVYRPAFQAIGGFRETLPYAAGEDIDLGVRLWSQGMLSYAPDAIVYHDFEQDLLAFMKRFLRYGRGNRRLTSMRRI